VIIDWSDAAVGSPFVDLVTWIAWAEADGEAEAAAEGWLDAWSDDVDVAALRARLDDVIAIGAAYQVISYDGIGRALEPATRYTMAGGGDNFLKRLEEPRLIGQHAG
jgi:aminoglycoside phosphotransferase (APT) family kinase protein